jgi:hypothetical protein
MTYDLNGNMTLITSFYKDETNTIWDNFSKMEYTYDSIGNETLYISSLWNKTAQDWENNYKTEFTYDSKRNNTVSVSYNSVLNGTNSSLEMSLKDEYSYDSNGNQILWIEYSRDKVDSLWVGSFKEEVNVDSNGNKTLIAYYIGGSNNSWVGTSKMELIYDNNGNETFAYSYIYNSDWIQNAINTFYYSEIMNTPVTNPDNIKIRIFPNPVKNDLQIRGLKESSLFMLFDSNGKTVFSKCVLNNESINLSALSTGIYLIRLITKEGAITSKLTKE